jgi:hypothetical protein
VGVEPDERDPAVARGERLDRADVRAAAAAEHERPLGQVDRDREGLLVERLLLDHRRLGNGSGRRAASAIASPPSPQACGTRTRPAPNSSPQAWHS